MAEKWFVVELADGSIQPILAESGDQDDEKDGYVFFVNARSEIVGLFAKDVVRSWREERDRTVASSSERTSG
jgi:hypothetical protein